LNQKVRGMDRVFGCHPAQTKTPPADRQNLSHRVELKDCGNPRLSPLESGKQAVMQADRQAVEVPSEKAKVVL
jgi:hypothetical protein